MNPQTLLADSTIAFLPTLAESENVKLAAIVMGCAVAIFAIAFGAVKSMVAEKERERTRREIAAYIAEGTMTPADGERILKAAPPDDE